jgi:hypothetical protein
MSLDPCGHGVLLDDGPLDVSFDEAGLIMPYESLRRLSNPSRKL